MSSKKVITVFGATGLQGGSVASVFLNDPALNTEWAVRAVTRDVTKPSAKKLAEQGAHVVSVRNGPAPVPVTCCFAELSHLAKREI